jgi:hypothetical protein
MRTKPWHMTSNPSTQSSKTPCDHFLELQILFPLSNVCKVNLLVLYLLEQGKHEGYVIICDVHCVCLACLIDMELSFCNWSKLVLWS